MARAAQAASGDQKLSRLANRLPWIEAVATIVLGAILYFPFKSQDLAKLTWALGGLQTLGSITYDFRLQRELRPVRKLAEVMDLSLNCSVADLSAMNQVYLRIGEPEFQGVKNNIIREASEGLLKLANDKTSNPLPAGEYYSWLLPIIESSQPHSTIWALSLMLEYEWDDSPAERRFLEASLSAAQRGVSVERIFVMKRDVIAKALENHAVRVQTKEEGPPKFVGYYVDFDYLERHDPSLVSRLGLGFIAFDRRVALIDLVSPDGQIRGRVTMNAAEITRLAMLYEQLKMHSDLLSLEIASA